MILPQKMVRLSKRPFLYFTIYALLTIIMTWPAFGQLGTHIPGTIGDSYVHLWTFTWLKNNLLHLTSLDAFYTNLIYHPVGVSLLNHNLAWVNFAIWLPLQAVFGPEAGYTLAFLLIFPLNGLSAYWLAREIRLTETAAFFAGLITAFWPYNLSHHGHPNLILIAWVILALLYLHRLHREPRWQNTAGFGIFVALIGITRWQLLIMATPLIGGYVFWVLLQNKGPQFWPLVKKIALAALISILFMLPFFTPLLLHQIGRTNPDDIILDEFAYPTDLVAYFTPGSYHPLWGENIQPIIQNFVGNYIYVRTVGYIALLLALLGIVRKWPQAKIWFLLLLTYTFLALGSDLYIAGQPIVPLPFRLIEDSFLIKSLRFPDRFNVMLIIPFGILAAMGVETLLSHPKFRLRSKQVGFLLALFILFEYINVFQMHSLAIPKWYDSIVADEASYAILDIPAFTREKFNSQYMYFQLYHNKALVEGNIARTPPETLGFIKQLPMLSQIQQNKNAPTSLVNPSYQLRQLANENVRYVIVHKEHLSSGELNSWQSWFVADPLYQDEEVIVYITDAATFARTVEIEKVFVGSEANPHLGLVSSAIIGDTAQGSWIGLETVWKNMAVPLTDSNLNLCFTLEHQTVAYQEKNCRPVSEEWPTSLWENNEIVWANYSFQISPFAEPGDYQTFLYLEDEDANRFGQIVPLNSIEVAPLARQFSPGQPGELAAANWEGEVFLTGFDIQERSEQLSVTLHWHVEQRVEKYYKFFIHLIDSERGELVAQLDFVPRDWSYPTNWWEAGEYVMDTAVLPLNNVGSGTYQLLVGIYDPETGQRLLATSAESDTPVDALLLTEINR